MQQGQSSQATGTRNVTYDIVAVLYHALQGAENCQTYLNDAQEGELRSFFEEALGQQRQLADRAKQLLSSQLQNEGGQGDGGSAFGFSGSSSSQNEPSLSGPSGGIGGSGGGIGGSGGSGGSF
jgi:hypothetical protein